MNIALWIAQGLLTAMNVMAGILPWLTPIAAAGLAIVQLLAIFTEHLPKREYNVIPVNAVLLGLSSFVILQRWILFS